MAQLIPATEQKHIKLGVLDRLRAPNDTQISTGVESTKKAAIHGSPSELWRKHKVIHPELPEKVVWDVAVCFLIIYSIVSITYTIAFGVEEHACSWPTNGWMGKSPCA